MERISLGKAHLEAVRKIESLAGKVYRSGMEGAEGRAREATRRDPLAVYDRYRGGDRGRIKRSASEERMEQVREFDGEQAYEKMMREMEEARQEKARQAEMARAVERARLEWARQETARQKQGAPWAGTRGTGAGLWPQPLSGSGYRTAQMLDLPGGKGLSNGFQRTLDHIRSIADSEAHKGRLFERLMKTYFIKDPLYQERFSQVWLWADWAALKPDFDGTDTGIDLVAEEREGGYCAIQCKCYAPGTQISKPHLDSFIAASARDPFTARIMVDTGDEWGPNAVKTIAPLKPACAVLRFGDLASRPFDWPDLVHGEPEALTYRRELFSLRPHQKTALDDVDWRLRGAGSRPADHGLRGRARPLQRSA